jgi:hypothetical protein
VSSASPRQANNFTQTSARILMCTEIVMMK